MNLRKDLENFRKALVSNKEDSGIIEKELGEMSILLDYYSKYVDKIENRINRNHVLHELEMPILFIGGTIFGIGAANYDTSFGKGLMIAGGCTMIGFELQYHLGKLVFKIY